MTLMHRTALIVFSLFSVVSARHGSLAPRVDRADPVPEYLERHDHDRSPSQPYRTVAVNLFSAVTEDDVQIPGGGPPAQCVSDQGQLLPGLRESIAPAPTTGKKRSHLILVAPKQGPPIPSPWSPT
jgi:hypothetical protein